MLSHKLIQQRTELRNVSGGREEMGFLGGKVILNFLLEMLRDFRLPGLQF